MYTFEHFDKERLKIDILRKSIFTLSNRLERARSEYEASNIESVLIKEKEELKQLQSDNPENFI